MASKTEVMLHKHTSSYLLKEIKMAYMLSNSICLTKCLNEHLVKQIPLLTYKECPDFYSIGFLLCNSIQHLRNMFLLFNRMKPMFRVEIIVNRNVE